MVAKCFVLICQLRFWMDESEAVIWEKRQLERRKEVRKVLFSVYGLSTN